MPVIVRTYNNGEIVKYIPDCNLSIDMFNFGSTNVVDQLNIFNFEQNNENDFILKETVINQNTGPPDIFNSNNIIINRNLNISTLDTNITNVFNNEGNTFVENNLYLEDRFIASDYSIQDDLICKKNLVIKNSNRFSEFGLDMNIKEFNNESLLIEQDFIVENNINTKQNIYINNNLNSTSITYNNININNELKIFNNFNSFANLNINNIYLDKSFNSENNIIVDDSIIIKNNALYLPKISIHDDLDGSIRYNEITKNIEAYITNNWNVLNELQNLENTSRVKHHEYFKPYIGSNIDFIQNNNISFTINSNNKNILLNHKNVNMNNIYVENNLNTSNIYNVTENINIVGNSIVKNNLFIKNNQLLVISSNNNSIANQESNIKNGSIRYNNEDNLYQIYINKWKPLQQISNNNNISNIQLYPRNDSTVDYDTILFNLNKSIVLNINRLSSKFINETLIIENNLNVVDNLLVSNNINTETLNINNNKIYSKNGHLVNLIDSIENKIGYENLFIDNLIDLDLDKFTFYSSKITTVFEKCNIINPIILNSDAIINYSPFIFNYKIYNEFNITKIVVYSNQSLTSSEFILKINNSDNIEFTLNNNYCFKNIDQDIIINSDLFIDIKSKTLLVNDLQLIIVLYGTYKNQKGILLKPHSSNLIDTKNNFEQEDRIIYGNTTINKNLNIISNHNLHVPCLNITDNIGIGTTYIDNSDFMVKNKSNTILVHKNNKLGIHTNTPNYKLDINIDNLTIDNNFNNTHTLVINKNLNNVSNLNISNNLIVNNINKNNFILKDSIILLNNVVSNYNLNINNNVNVNNLTISPNLLFSKNTYNSNIIFNNNTLKFNINSIIHNSNYFPLFSDNNIYIQDNKNINIKYESNNLLNITSESFNTNNYTDNNSSLFSISENFNINKNEIIIKSRNLIVNDINILDKLDSIERYYYSPYNININKVNNNNSFNITYNRPGFYYNLNNSINHNTKKIDYIAFQFCLGHANSHINPNWNSNSFIYYEPIENINFIKSKFNYSTNLDINLIDENNYINSPLQYDFNNTIHTYNLNISNSKTQLIYNTSDTCIFKNDLTTNPNITLRMYPIYNIRDNYLYYSNPIHFSL